MKKADRDAAMDWIDKNQLARRNLTPDQMSIIRGRMYKRADKQQGRRNDLTSCQTGPKLQTAEVVAKRTGVSPRTVKRDAKRYEFVEKLKKTKPEAARAVLTSKKRSIPTIALSGRSSKEPQSADG